MHHVNDVWWSSKDSNVPYVFLWSLDDGECNAFIT